MCRQLKKHKHKEGHIWQQVMKRTFDILLSIFCLIIFSPAMLICALAVRWGVGHPIIFKQERIGRYGKPFMIYKFRSMRVDEEEDSAPQLYQGDDDKRLTPVGKFLRSHHFDELPQLWNVLKGDMSFVGYRPEREFFIDQIMEQDPRYAELFYMRPGITSIATLYNGYTDNMEKMLKRLELDLFYMKRCSLRMDMAILWRTLAKTVTGKIF